MFEVNGKHCRYQTANQRQKDIKYNEQKLKKKHKTNTGLQKTKYCVARTS